MFYYENQMAAGVINKILLTGGSARIPNVTRFFAENLGVECDLLDPIGNMSLGSDVDRDLLEDYKPVLGVGIGLALRNVI